MIATVLVLGSIATVGAVAVGWSYWKGCRRLDAMMAEVEGTSSALKTGLDELRASAARLDHSYAASGGQGPQDEGRSTYLEVEERPPAAVVIVAMGQAGDVVTVTTSDPETQDVTIDAYWWGRARRVLELGAGAPVNPPDA